MQQQMMHYKFYDLGAKLYGIFNIRTHGRIADLFGPLADAQKSLDALIKGDPIELKIAKSEAVKLLTQISALFDKYFIDQSSRQVRFPSGEAKIDAQELALIELALEKFESALAAELGRVVVYTAVQRGIYSAADLIENAHRAVPDDLLAYVPDAAQRELDAAGRALGFALGTAAAVHTLRALEIVTAAYYELFNGAPAHSRGERNLATYLRKLTTMAEDEDVKMRPDLQLVQLLTQIKETYRNPVQNIEAAMTESAAATLFGLVTSAITQLAEHIGEFQGRGARAAAVARAPVAAMKKKAEREEPEAAPETGAESETAPMPTEEPGAEDEGEDEEDIYDFRVSQTG